MDEPVENLLTDFAEPEYKYVGFWPRFGALLIDAVVLWAIAIPLNWFLSDWTSPLGIIISSLIPFLYNPILEYKFGATIGKMALGIKIVNYDLKRLTISNVILRNIIYFSIEIVTLALVLYNYYTVFDADEGLQSMADIFSFQFSPEIILRIIVLVIYIVEVIFLLTDEKHRALHDRIGKNYVVRKMR